MMKNKNENKLNELYKKLNVSQRAFIAAYFGVKYDEQGKEVVTNIFNATQAARDAGYSYPKQQGYRLTKHPVIKEIINIYMDDLTMPKGELLARVSEQARSDMADFIKNDGEIDIVGVKTNGHLVKKFSFRRMPSKIGIIEEQQIELHDAQKALVLLGKHYGLWKPEKKEDDKVDFEVIEKAFESLTDML